MRLVDLTDSEDTTDVPDADEVNDSAEIEEVTTTAASEKSPAMSMEKAKALLKQLQVCETRAFIIFTLFWKQCPQRGQSVSQYSKECKHIYLAHPCIR